jgi:hypothetical protein
MEGGPVSYPQNFPKRKRKRKKNERITTNPKKKRTLVI